MYIFITSRLSSRTSVWQGYTLPALESVPSLELLWPPSYTHTLAAPSLSLVLPSYPRPPALSVTGRLIEDIGKLRINGVEENGRTNDHSA